VENKFSVSFTTLLHANTFIIFMPESGSNAESPQGPAYFYNAFKCYVASGHRYTQSFDEFFS